MRKRSRAELGRLVHLDPYEAAFEPHDKLLRLAFRRELGRAPKDVGQPRVRLQALHLERVGSADLGALHELRNCPLVDAVLAEGGEDVRDVLHEGRVRADDEDPPQLRAVGVEQVRGAVEADGRLARARAALDHERRLRLTGDQAVLVGLDRGDDVAHTRVAGAFELLEQEVVDRSGVGQRAVERLVADVDQLAAARAEAPP